MAELVENCHLGADVIDHEGILAELNFNTEFSFHKIHITKRAFGKWRGFSVQAFLVLRKKQQQHHRLDRRCVANSLLGVAQVPVR